MKGRRKLRKITLLLIPSLLFLVGSAFGYDIALLPSQVSPLKLSQLYPDYPTQDYILSRIKSPSQHVDRILNTKRSPITISGIATDNNVSFSHIIGTKRKDNPHFGFDFYGEGTVTYHYTLPYYVTFEQPVLAKPGERFGIEPRLEYFGGASLSASQDIQFGTEFFFGFKVNMPWPIPDI